MVAGICNYNGDIIIPAKYASLEKVGNYYFSYSDKLYYLLNVAEKKLQPIAIKNIELYEENGVIIATKKRDNEVEQTHNNTTNINSIDSNGVFDDKGNLILPTKYTEIHGYKSFIACKENVDDKQYKLFDLQGNGIKNAIYDNITAISGLHQPVVNTYIVEYNGKSGIINTNAKILVPLEYDYVKYTKNGWFIFSKEDKYGAIDTNFSKAIPAQYNWLDALDATTLAFNIITNGYRKFGLIDEKKTYL
jgi:hypothetical protein